MTETRILKYQLTLEMVLLSLTDEEAEYVLTLRREVFWAWYARRMEASS